MRILPLIILGIVVCIASNKIVFATSPVVNEAKGHRPIFAIGILKSDSAEAVER